MTNSPDGRVHLQKLFDQLFGGSSRLYRAPGRVNLIGEHTDYNQGFVMPALLVADEPQAVVGYEKTRPVPADPVPELLEEFLLVNAVPGDSLLRRHVVRKGEHPDADDAAEGPIKRRSLEFFVLAGRLSRLQKVVLCGQIHSRKGRPFLFGRLDRLDVQHHFHGSKDFHMMIASW